MKPIDFVGAWQYALDHFLKSFLEVAFPVIAAVIDWKVTPVSLDKELREIMPEAQPDPDLENRLNDRCQRFFDRFGVGVTHVTVLAGEE